VDPTAGFDAAGLEADTFIECSGVTAAVQQGLEAVRPGGHAVLVGHGDEQMLLPVLDLQFREVTLTGVFRYVDTWPVAISLAAAGRVDLDALVTSRFGLDGVEAALRSDRDPANLKSVVEVNGDNR
jgi:L-iditol 2-dehydrogenase